MCERETGNMKTMWAPSLRCLAIELTNNCTFKCAKCWSQSPNLFPARPKGYMTAELFYKILDEVKHDSHFKKAGMAVAPSYGGEAMLHPRFEEFSRALANSGFEQVQIATNGTQLNTHNDEVLLKYYTSIAVSVHKQPGMWRTLQKARELYKRRKGKSPPIRLNIVAEEFTQNDFNDIAVKMRGWCDGAKIISYISEDLKMAGGRKPDGQPCLSMSTYLGVMWNGETVPCCHILNPGEWSLGNVAKTSLKDVFFGQTYNKLRNGFMQDTLCEKCEVRR